MPHIYIMIYQYINWDATKLYMYLVNIFLVVYSGIVLLNVLKIKCDGYNSVCYSSCVVWWIWIKCIVWSLVDILGEWVSIQLCVWHLAYDMIKQAPVITGMTCNKIDVHAHHVSIAIHTWWTTPPWVGGGGVDRKGWVPVPHPGYHY